MKRIFTSPLPLIFLLASCATNDSELTTGRIVEKGETTVTLGYQYLTEYDTDVWEQRRRYDFSEDYNANAVAQGFNVLLRRSFFENMDFALNLSHGSSSGEARYGLWNGERFSTALGAKLLLPTYAFDVPTLYRYKLVWYNSYELLPNFALYAAPHIEWKPFGGVKRQYRGISGGFVVGKDTGIVVEAVYAKAQFGDDPKSYEQFTIAYTTGLDKLRGRLKEDSRSSYIKLLPGLGSSVFPTPSLGLIARYLHAPVDYELSVDLGIGPIPNLSETKIGLMTSRLFAVRARYGFHPGHFAKLGFARKELRGNFDLEDGWHSLYTYNYGMEWIWEQVFSDWNISWVGIYVPLLFLPHGHSYYGDHWKPSDEFVSLAKTWERKLSLSFLNIHKEF